MSSTRQDIYRKIGSTFPWTVVIITFCGAQPPAAAAGFTCTGQLTAQEQAVCDDSQLSGLDSELNDMYRSLMATLPTDDARALQLGQRAWLKGVGKTCQLNSADQSNAYPAYLAPRFVACLRGAYDARIENLSLRVAGDKRLADRQNQPPATARDLADRIGGQLPQILGGEGNGLRIHDIATVNGLTLAADRTELPRPASPALKMAIKSFIIGTTYYEFTTPDAPGAAVTLSGSANCSSWMGFDWRGDQAQRAELPEVLQGGWCSGWGGSGGLASRNGRTFAIAAFDSGDKFTWIIQAWLGSGWSRPEARTAALSIQSSAQPQSANCTGSHCAKLQNLALDLARRSNINNPSDSDFVQISESDKALLKSLAAPTDPQSEFSQKYYGENARTTIVDFEGQRLVVCAGTGVVAGWRTDGLIHIEMWLLQSASLTPVAEFVFTPERKPIYVNAIADWHPDLH